MAARQRAAGAAAAQRRVDVRGRVRAALRVRQPIAVVGHERVDRLLRAVEDRLRGKRPITSAAATTIPKTQVSRPWMSLTALFSGLSSGPNISFWYMVSRYIAERMTAVAEMAPISLGAGKKPIMRRRRPGLVRR